MSKDGKQLASGQITHMGYLAQVRRRYSEFRLLSQVLAGLGVPWEHRGSPFVFIIRPADNEGEPPYATQSEPDTTPTGSASRVMGETKAPPSPVHSAAAAVRS